MPTVWAPAGTTCLQTQVRRVLFHQVMFTWRTRSPNRCQGLPIPMSMFMLYDSALLEFQASTRTRVIYAPFVPPI